MRPTQLLRASHYKPMIKFLGNSRKTASHPPHKAAPHPCAPPEIRESFSSFLSKLESSSSSSSSSSAGAPSLPKDTGFKPSGKPNDYENFWEAPTYLWTPKEFTEREIEAIMSGGATDIRQGP
ncbi:hypothetical protein IAT38_000016 [Cryptococcus sp. DSM 104549]